PSPRSASATTLSSLPPPTADRTLIQPRWSEPAILPRVLGVPPSRRISSSSSALKSPRCCAYVRKRPRSSAFCAASAAARRPSSPSRHVATRSEEHTSELQSRSELVCRLLLEKKKW